MIDLLAFAVVAFALGTPGLVHLLWGQIEVDSRTAPERPSPPKAGKRHPR
jgi:hypothetical protein